MKAADRMTESTLTDGIVRAVMGARSVPCLYCSLAIPADTFLTWSTCSRLTSASCPACGRRITLPTESLHELAGHRQLGAS
jgi:hypothetical protein